MTDGLRRCLLNSIAAYRNAVLTAMGGRSRGCSDKAHPPMHGTATDSPPESVCTCYHSLLSRLLGTTAIQIVIL